MRKKIQLHIPEPCHQEWNTMTPDEKGRFCSSCQKQVTDFTTMSDEQLVAFFRKRSKESVCGRVMNDQLHRDIIVLAKRIPWIKYFFQFALPAVLASSKVASQGQIKVLSAEPVITATAKLGKVKNSFAIETVKKLTGKIVDEFGSAIPYATVNIKGTPIVTSCDSTGNFNLEYHEPGDSIVLQVSSAGFKVAESAILLNNNSEDIVIALETQEPLDEVIITSTADYFMGRVVVGLISAVIKEDAFDVIPENTFPAIDSWKLYPNPVQQNSTLTLETGTAGEGQHLIQLLATSGQIIMKKEVWIDKNSSSVKLEIPFTPAGVYFLRIRNKHSGKNMTEKIVVTD